MCTLSLILASTQQMSVVPILNMTITASPRHGQVAPGYEVPSRKHYS